MHVLKKIELNEPQCYRCLYDALAHTLQDNKPEYPEDTAAARNHGALKTDLYHYRQVC